MKKRKKEPKTLEQEVYFEVEDSPEGQKIIEQFANLLLDLRHNKAYLNGWTCPVKKKK